MHSSASTGSAWGAYSPEFRLFKRGELDERERRHREQQHAEREIEAEFVAPLRVELERMARNGGPSIDRWYAAIGVHLDIQTLEGWRRELHGMTLRNWLDIAVRVETLVGILRSLGRDEAPARRAVEILASLRLRMELKPIRVI